METAEERYNFLQKSSGLSKLEFARSLGVSKERGYSLSKGVFHASREVLSRLSNNYNVDLNWYIFGEGSPYRPENLQAVYVAGDSMIGEHIYNGDAVVFHPGLTEGNGIYVLSLDTALLVKRVSFDDLPRSVSLISANPAYPPRQIAGEELENLRIAGRVVTCVHRV
jgi:hypothetical protein